MFMLTIIDKPQHKEIDMNPIAVSPVWQRWSVFDFTTSSKQSNFQMMVKYPEEEKQLMAIIRPFSFLVGLLMLKSNILFFLNKVTNNIFSKYI